MSGSHNRLADLSTCDISPCSFKNLMREFVEFLLSSQLVEHHQGSFYRVMKGSGMGLSCSGEISDYNIV